VIGYLTGLKAQKEKEEKQKYQETAEDLQKSLDLTQRQSEKIEEIEEQLRLADRLSIVGELTASLAHEVRNPLGAIQGAVEILQEELPEASKNAEFFEILLEETGRLNNVVENYLNFSRAKSSQMSRFDVNEMLRNISMLLRTKARKENINFKLETEPGEVILEANKSEIQQILMNLAMNAIQAIKNGGEITLRSDIIQSAGRNGDPVEKQGRDRAVRITVKDEGSGINPAELDKIFQPFYTTKIHGTGLGLAIIKRIVEKNRWQISVDSGVNKGSQFSVIVPGVMEAG
jgi:signal transduction histidine kinase